MEKIFARTKGMIPMVIFLTLSGSIRATINEYITKFISLDFISCHCSMALLPHILVRRKLNLKLTLSWDIVYIALAIKLVHMRVYQYQKCSYIIFVKSKFCVCVNFVNFLSSSARNSSTPIMNIFTYTCLAIPHLVKRWFWGKAEFFYLWG